MPDIIDILDRKNSGLNVIIGQPGTGKTKLINTLYSNKLKNCVEVNNSILDSTFSYKSYKEIDKECPLLNSLNELKSIIDKYLNKYTIPLIPGSLDSFKTTIIPDSIKILINFYTSVYEMVSYDKTTLLWDLLENGIHPELLYIIINIILELQELGYSIFLTTNSYIVLKMIDIKSNPKDITFYSLYFENNEVLYEESKSFLGIRHNHISKVYSYLYNLTLRSIYTKKGGESC